MTSLVLMLLRRLVVVIISFLYMHLTGYIPKEKAFMASG